MPTSPGNTCDGCYRDLFDYAGTIHECPGCGAGFCDECVAMIDAADPAACPKCGCPRRRPPRLVRPPRRPN